MSDWEYHTMPEYTHLLNSFADRYEIECNFHVPNSSIAHLLKKRKDRVCIYCGKAASKDVKFKKDAHVIPQGLGNRFAISDIECDNCNKFFQPFESDLAAYLGIDRTLTKTPGKKGIPTATSLYSSLVAREYTLLGTESIFIQKDSVNGESMQMLEDGRAMEITFNKQPYKPVNVYKILLKVALAFIDPSDVPFYKHAFDYLMGKECDNFGSFQKVFIYEFLPTFRFAAPYIFLFKRKENVKDAPMHQFALYAQNRIYVFYLPFNLLDISAGLYNTDLVVHHCPPISSTEVIKEIKHSGSLKDFSSSEVNRSDMQVYRLEFSDTIDNPVILDIETMTTTPGVIKDVIGIHMIRKGHTWQINNGKRNS